MKPIEELGISPAPWHDIKITSTYIDSKGYVIGRGLGTHSKIRMHRLVMEKHLGRRLLPTEDVHHKDGDKTNNNISNLEIIKHGDHSVITNKGRDYKNGYQLSLKEEERERRREWGRSVLSEANRKLNELRKTGVQSVQPTTEQMKRRFWAKRWRANQKVRKARAALEKAGGAE